MVGAEEKRDGAPTGEYFGSDVSGQGDIRLEFIECYFPAAEIQDREMDLSISPESVEMGSKGQDRGVGHGRKKKKDGQPRGSSGGSSRSGQVC